MLAVGCSSTKVRNRSIAVGLNFGGRPPAPVSDCFVERRAAVHSLPAFVTRWRLLLSVSPDSLCERAAP